MILLLMIVTFLILLLVYFVEKDIISPSFIFCGVFLVSELNVFTNVERLNVRISIDTFGVVVGGIFLFFIGTILASYIIGKIRFPQSIKNRELYLTKKQMRMLLIFNIFSILVILNEVYKLTVQKASYSGNVLGALGIYAEVSKFQSIDMSISTIATILSAICEAEGYTLGYIIADNLARKKRLNKLTVLCFITSFLSTFCQGSRGGMFMIVVAVFSFLLAYREEHNMRSIGIKLIFKILIIICISIGIFQLIGVITGKMWNVSFYEYLSVYLGDPLINLNTKLREGIVRTTIMGQSSFPSLIKKLYQAGGWNISPYYGLSDFQYYEGYNLGNVYTIFSNLIADYGIYGMYIAILIIGFCVQTIYIIAKKNKEQVCVERIIWGYVLTSVAFSFFSNKVCQNITFFRLIMFIFAWALIRFVLTKKVVT